MKWKISEFCLDQETGIVSRGSYEYRLDPKVLSVLLVLLERPGEIISQQEIIARVWSDTVVGQNALHRCIGELRKAFHDNAKQQSVISTYSKRGYSLTASVHGINTPVFRGIPIPFASGIAAFSFFVLVVVLELSMELDSGINNSEIQFDQLAPLTSSDETEFYSEFSPDGLYVAFARQTTGPYNHIYAKNLGTNAEYRLTAEPGVLNDPSWSLDGSRLLYVRVQCVDENCLVPERECMSIEVVGFSPSRDPQAPKTIVPCTPSVDINTPRWLSNNEIAYIERSGESVRVITIDSQGTDRQIVYQDPRFDPYYLSFTPNISKLAIAIQSVSPATDASMPSEMLLWDVNRNKFETFAIDSDNKNRWRPNWLSDGSGFLMSSNNKLYQLSLQGKVKDLGFPSSNRIFLPSDNPASPGIAMTVGQYDYDIVEIILQDQSNPLIETRNRTTRREEFAVYRPGSEEVAFFSNRTGSNQIWISSSGNAYQISRFEIEDRSSPLAWSPDGASLAAVYVGQLRLFEFVNSKSMKVDSVRELSHLVSPKLHEWIDESSLLLSIGAAGERALAKYSINSKSIEVLAQGDFYSVRHSQGGELYAQTAAPSGAYKIKSLSESGLAEINQLEDYEFIPGLILMDDLLIGVTVQRELLVYSVQEKEIITRLDLSHTKVRFLSDVLPSRNALLFNNRPEMRSELFYWHN